MELEKNPFAGLGRLEVLHQRLKELNNKAQHYCLLVFAGDNGVSCENTSIYGAMTSSIIVEHHLHGRAPTVQLLKRLGKKEFIVDVGLAAKIEHPGLINHNVRRGSANFLREDALQEGEVRQAIEIGRSMWEEINYSQFDIVGVGEIGVANTLCAAALATLMTGHNPDKLVGRGSRDDKVIEKKVDIISRALEMRYPDENNIIDALARFGGLEIAALAGFISGAAKKKRAVVLDGYVTAVAAFLASNLDAGVPHYLIAPSLSVEVGHSCILDKLNLQAIFDLDINYGEGLAAVIGLFLAEMTAKFHGG